VSFEKEAELVEENVAPRWRRRLVVVGSVVLLGLGAWGGWRWNHERATAQDKAEHAATIAAGGEQLAAAQMAVAEPNLAPEEQIRRLERLATLQREMASLQPERFAAELEAVSRTEQRIAAARAQFARQRSDEAEAAARARVEAGDTAGGAEQLREALRLQREMNASGDGARNFDRELRLQRQLAELTAEPLRLAAEAKAEQARAAVAESRWEEGRELFREARDIQERLNSEFPRTRYSDLSAIARLDAEIASLTADGLDAQVNERVQRARQLRTQGLTEEAAKEFAAAAALQRQLNARFGQSRFVSMERLDEIEAERQAVLVEEPLRQVRAKAEEARGFLRQRRIYQAQQCVGEALQGWDDLRVRFPKARLDDDELRTALAFLHLRSTDLAALQDRIYDQLAPLEGGSKAMLRTEVRQVDFVKVLSTNPSRNPGPALPVDSGTYAEAEEFCRRLGWVLGWRVRLPTEEEMRAAQVAEADFQNVTGSLTEWIASTGGREQPEATVWLGTGEFARAPRNERVRTRGFRVVVEVDLARLGEE
jgi:hypothetical protein